MEFQSPSQQLFCAVAFIGHPGLDGDFAEQIRSAVAAGADLNAYNEQGLTPLTYAIGGGMGSPIAVKLLLELGADPNRRDASGWSPWGVCLSRSHDAVVREEMGKVRALLEQYDIDRSDEVFLGFKEVIESGDLNKVKECLQQGVDINSSLFNPLAHAVVTGSTEISKYFLDAGLDPNGGANEVPNLVLAAQRGNRIIAELLLDYGADINAYGWGEKKYTAEAIARENGHKQLANWLSKKMKAVTKSTSVATPPKQSNSKFAELYDKQIDAVNYDLSTDDIVKQLQAWDERYTVALSEVGNGGFVLTFTTLPKDLDSFAEEVYRFCPDIVDQGYGCMDEMVEMAEISGQPIDPKTEALLANIDFADESFGLELLKKDLMENKKLGFWWD